MIENEGYGLNEVKTSYETDDKNLNCCLVFLWTYYCAYRPSNSFIAAIRILLISMVSLYSKLL